MAEGKGTPTSEQGKDSDKKRPPWWKRLWEWTEFGKKSGWNWLELLSALAIPVVLAIFGFWFTAQQDARQQKIENQRAAAERELAEQRAQDEALQAYLDQMGSLLLEKHLRALEPDSEVVTLARARTLTVLSRLDPGRKADVIQFLVEAGLVGTNPYDTRGIEERSPQIISLRNADLSGVVLKGVGMQTSILSNRTEVAFLGQADLRGANLRDANLSGAWLAGTLLNYADLSDANLSKTILTTAQLGGADLSKADLSGVWLDNANLVDLEFYDPADLSEADLSEAHLGGSNLRMADLSGTDLSGAHLSGADLSGAKGWTEKQLSAAASLDGATMPDGQTLKSAANPDGPTFEEWLKRKAREEDGENTVPS